MSTEGPIFVCPLPRLWNRVYEALYAAWKETGGGGPPPPRPLILGGWRYTNDLDKQRVWEQTVEWANLRGLDHVIPEIDDEEAHMVYALTTWERIGPFGGPMYLDWDFEPKTRPSARFLRRAMTNLVHKWETVAGSELAEHTHPLRFTGKKRRRLLVGTDLSWNPPWGTWDVLTLADRRRAFTEFRKAVNDAIYPHMVDHIGFTGR